MIAKSQAKSTAKDECGELTADPNTENVKTLAEVMGSEAVNLDNHLAGNGHLGSRRYKRGNEDGVHRYNNVDGSLVLEKYENGPIAFNNAQIANRIFGVDSTRLGFNDAMTHYDDDGMHLFGMKRVFSNLNAVQPFLNAIRKDVEIAGISNQVATDISREIANIERGGLDEVLDDIVEHESLSSSLVSVYNSASKQFDIMSLFGICDVLDFRNLGVVMDSNGRGTLLPIDTDGFSRPNVLSLVDESGLTAEIDFLRQYIATPQYQEIKDGRILFLQQAYGPDSFIVRDYTQSLATIEGVLSSGRGDLTAEDFAEYREYPSFLNDGNGFMIYGAADFSDDLQEVLGNDLHDESQFFLTKKEFSHLRGDLLPSPVGYSLPMTDDELQVRRSQIRDWLRSNDQRLSPAHSVTQVVEPKRLAASSEIGNVRP